MSRVTGEVKVVKVQEVNEVQVQEVQVQVQVQVQEVQVLSRCTALMIACMHGYLEVAQEILARPDVDVRD